MRKYISLPYGNINILWEQGFIPQVSTEKSLHLCLCRRLIKAHLLLMVGIGLILKIQIPQKEKELLLKDIEVAECLLFGYLIRKHMRLRPFREITVMT